MGSTSSKIAVLVFCWFALSIQLTAQSTDPNFPTFVTSNEISGTVPARDIGDSRLTSYYYAFDGGQGDIFINAVTRNFTGDIDVFATEGLRPLTKMVIFADGSSNETGRLIYLRKGERMILRIQGRSPNDDPASFRIKFGGSFIALAGQKSDGEAPKISEPDGSDDSGVRVNSVGTIIKVIPKPPPPKRPVETVAREGRPAEVKEPKPQPTPVVIVTDNSPAAKPETKKEIAAAPANTPRRSRNTSSTPTVFGSGRSKRSARAGKPVTKTPKPPAPPAEAIVDPLASIRLVVQLKDGKSIERPMSEILKFSVDQGVLTVIAKDGTILHYSILDVAKVTIE